MIARTRKRPREHSFSFQTLGWLLALEASYQVCCQRVPYRGAWWTRKDFFTRYRSHPSRPGWQIINAIPSRRFTP